MKRSDFDCDGGEGSNVTRGGRRRKVRRWRLSGWGRSQLIMDSNKRRCESFQLCFKLLSSYLEICNLAVFHGVWLMLVNIFFEKTCLEIYVNINKIIKDLFKSDSRLGETVTWNLNRLNRRAVEHSGVLMIWSGPGERQRWGLTWRPHPRSRWRKQTGNCFFFNELNEFKYFYLT